MSFDRCLPRMVARLWLASGLRLRLLLASGFVGTMLIGAHAQAEAPMTVDDASTLDRGSFKVETTLQRDGGRRFMDALFGFGAFQGLEVEVAAGWGRDRDYQPSADLRGAALGLKWVPVQAEEGWSLGLRYDYGRLRVRPSAPALGFNEAEQQLTGLATYRFGKGYAAHINLGLAYSREDGESDSSGTWGLGFEVPVLRPLTLTAETYSLRSGSVQNALGIRYVLREGLKASAAAGRGDGISFGRVGLAWEF